MISRPTEDHRITTDSKELTVTAWADLIPHRVQTSDRGSEPPVYPKANNCARVYRLEHNYIVRYINISTTYFGPYDHLQVGYEIR